MIKCEICKGPKPNTIAETIEGKKVNVHSTKCLAIFNTRKASKQKREPMIRGWVTKWAEDRWGFFHSQDPPCQCPRHRKENKPTDIKYTDE